MQSNSPNLRCIAGVLLLSIVSLSPIILADPASESLTAEILTDWVDDGSGNTTHAYRIVLSESVDFANLEKLNVSVNHHNASGELVGLWQFNWTGGNNTELRIMLNSEINWKDEVEIVVLYDDAEIGNRMIVVTIWNEPLSDHEITRTTLIQMTHEAINATASESYTLNFIGQGWQSRVGESLESNELGTGTLEINESIDGGTISIVLWLSTVWLNESTVGVELQSQVFEMYGNGTLEMHTSDDGMDIDVYGQVVNSHIVRNWVEGVVEEKLRIEASGNLSLEESGGGEFMEADGDLALFLIETHDIDGQRILSNTEIEATADMVIHSDDAHLELDVQQLIQRERWDNGQFTSSENVLKADGTFDFSDSEENSSMVVNGTVHNIFQESINGMKTADQLHIDGTFSGDIDGNFGVVRDIVQSGPQSNATGQMFQVNVIHQESWVNLTGGGSNIFEMEAVHNNTWEYEVPQNHWDNRTVRLRWDSNEGGETSTGDEYPEESPIMNEMDVPEPDSAIGDVDITRETGFSPSQMKVGDTVSLLDSEFMHLTVTATHTGTVNRDGHSIPVTHWLGNYDLNGTASGAVVSEGILAGLIAEVSRQVSVPLEGEGESVTLSESQSLERVLSPSIITSGENSAPEIVSVAFREGSLVNENGMIGHLEVEVDDPDWNVRSVSVDMSGINLGIVTLNDRGLNGDYAIHDDIFTTEIVYPGVIEGFVSVDVLAVDDFASVEETQTIQLLNRVPRVTEMSYSPNTLHRGENTTVTMTVIDSSGVASVGVDTTQWGGGLTLLTKNGESWTGEIKMPLNIPSGDQILPVRVEDELGGQGTTTMLTLIQSGDNTATGPYNIEEMPPVHLLNEGPSISNVTFWDDQSVVNSLESPNEGANVYTLTAKVTDGDSISIVQAKLSVIAPAGQSESWQPMRDDGAGVDLVAGDGIYSVQVEVRSGVPTGVVSFEIRGIDAQLAQTPVEERAFSVTINAPETNSGGGEKLFEGASQWWFILGVILLITVLAGIGIFTAMRKGDLEQMMGSVTLDPKEAYVQKLVLQGYSEDVARAHAEKYSEQLSNGE
ncbi:MAG: hypothetical protein QF440_02465 [Candidatus Thalassarchaeaceae archaeon]|jgi:hypothetical protein|nr:hypothetical protein [Candidatus Thalassarchaeaceae archaeon]